MDTPPKTLEEGVYALDGPDLHAFVRENTGLEYSTAALRHMLQTGNSLYARIFYALSTSNKTISISTFKSTFLYTNFPHFGEEDLLFICEGIKLQLERGEPDFYLVIHHFFGDVRRSEHLRLFLVFLVENGDYKIREFLITYDVIEKVFGYRISCFGDKLFVCKFLKAVVAMDSEFIRQYIVRKGLCIEIPMENDCMSFFASWLAQNGAGYKNIITVRNDENGSCR